MGHSSFDPIDARHVKRVPSTNSEFSVNRRLQYAKSEENASEYLLDLAQWGSDTLVPFRRSRRKSTEMAKVRRRP